MADPDTGMEKAEMKKLLAVSKQKPVNCGLGLTKDGAMLLMDKVKPPTTLMKQLQQKFNGMKSPNWGTAYVDTDNDPKLVIMTINKAMPGLARKMKKTLRGTGFSKVEVRLEDGSVAEASGEEDEEADDQSAPAAAAGDDTAAAPAAAAPAEDGGGEPQAGAAPAGPDAAELTRQLRDLAGRISKVAPDDPSQAKVLTQMASQAAMTLKQGDLQGAETAIANLQQALDGAAPAANARAGAPAAAPNLAAMGKAKLAWVATRKKIEGEIDKLHTEMAAAYKDHGFGADLDKFFRAKVDPVLDSLDESLAAKLDEVTSNTDPAKHAVLVSQAQAILQKYTAYVASEPIIAQLDENPFVPLQIQKTLTATLGALSKVVA